LGSLLLKRFAAFADTAALNDSGGAWGHRQPAHPANAPGRAFFGARLAPHQPVIGTGAHEVRDSAAPLSTWLAGGRAVPVARHAPVTVIDAVRAATSARFCVTNAADQLLTKLGGRPPYRSLLEGAAIIVLTSGSTGRPKGVVLSHRAFAGKLEAIDSMLGFTPRTRTLLVLQITFVFGI